MEPSGKIQQGLNPYDVIMPGALGEDRVETVPLVRYLADGTKEILGTADVDISQNDVNVSYIEFKGRDDFDSPELSQEQFSLYWSAMNPDPKIIENARLHDISLIKDPLPGFEIMSVETPPDPEPKSIEHRTYFEPHTGGRPEVQCTCGWRYAHVRAKVLNKAVERHESKTGHAWGGKDVE